MASISISVYSTLVNPANYFVGAVYDASSGSLLEFIAPTKPGGGYTDPFQITFLNSYTIGKVYRVIVWENTVNTGPGGTSRVSGSITPSSSTTSFRSDQRYIYGISSQFTSNTTIVDSSLIGWNISFEQFGSGTLAPGTDYTFDNTTGTIVLINGTTYQSGQNMIVHFLPQVTSGSAPPSSGVSSGGIVSVNTTLTNARANTAVYLQGSSGSFIATLPALSTMSDYQPIEFYSFGGNHINASLPCQGADKIQWNQLITQIILGQCESVTLFKANGVWNVKYPPFGINAAGELILSYLAAPINTIQAAGQLLSRSSYPRLWTFVQTLEAGCLTTEAAWASTTTINGIIYYTNKAKYTPGDGSTTFRVPLLYNYGSLKLIDGSSRFPGNLQPGQVGAFNANPLPIPIGDSFNGTAGGGWSGYVGRGQLNEAPATFNVDFNAGLENYPSNIGVYGLIRI